MTDHWTTLAASPLNDDLRAKALARQGELTKPPGSLGRLESLAVTLAAMQGRERPTADRVRIVIFAGDHGVAAEEQVSAFPPAVTVEMIKNFSRGGAAISVLSKSLGATLEVVNAGTVGDPGPLPGVIDRRVGPGTANLATGPAMTDEELDAALTVGREAVERAVADGVDLFVGGEMGIGNTTAAAAIGCLTLGLSGAAIAGPGTGLDEAGVSHKAAVIDRAVALHADHRDGAEPLRRVGGFEIAALAGAYIACAQRGVPALVDGFITTAAALAAGRINPGVADWLIYSHASAEPGHQALLTALSARPLVDLNLRLGEASGAATCVPLLRLACAIHNGMATFAEAGVSGAL